MSYHKTRNGNGTSALVTDAKDYASRHPACSVVVCGMLIWEKCQSTNRGQNVANDT